MDSETHHSTAQTNISSTSDQSEVISTSGLSTRGTPCEAFYHYHVSCDSNLFSRSYCRGLQSAYFAHCVNDEDPLASTVESVPKQVVEKPKEFTFAVSRRRTPVSPSTFSSSNFANTAACMKGQLLSYISNCTSQGHSQSYCRNLQSVYHSECVAK